MPDDITHYKDDDPLIVCLRALNPSLDRAQINNTLHVMSYWFRDYSDADKVAKGFGFKAVARRDGMWRVDVAL